MGNVALGVVNYLKRALSAEMFAEIVIDQMTVLDSVAVEDGLARIPEPPKNTFYYVKEHNLVIFEGEAQLSGENGIALLEKVLDLASSLGVSRIFTGAAFPMAKGYRDPVEIYSAVNKHLLGHLMRPMGVKPMDSGHISGLNGLLLGFAAKKGIDALCLLATIPQYAISIPNPQASEAIIGILSRTLGFKVDLGELHEYMKEMGEKMALIEDKVRDVFTVEEEKPSSPLPEKKRVPGYALDKIRRLFLEARSDKRKAIDLKQELDRWDLYKHYEDRFLDLFK
jgi:proteasome assembly chaperone (PAC2) family protein